MRKWITALLVSLALLSTLVSPAHADHPWPTVGAHWPGNPEGVVMVSNRSSIPSSDVAAAIKVWNASPHYNLVDIGPVCPSWTPHRCVTIYEREVPGESMGMATIHIPIASNNHILAADIDIDPGLTREVRRPLLVHEIGHALGLGHRTGGLSVMNANVDVDAKPDVHDFDQLAINRRH